MMVTRIESKLQHALTPTKLEVRDTSASHAGHGAHTGSPGTHFTIIIEAEAFRDLNRVQRHRKVYDCLDQEFKDGLHALQIKARCPGEA